MEEVRDNLAREAISRLEMALMKESEVRKSENAALKELLTLTNSGLRWLGLAGISVLTTTALALIAFLANRAFP